MSNIEESLRQSIFRYVENHSEISILSASELQSTTDAVAFSFIEDRSALWWWGALCVESTTEFYGDRDGMVRVRSILEGLDGPLTLVVTDDEYPPWEGVQGPLDALISMLREHSYFEYFIVDDSRSWILFDTHENSLVLAKKA